MCDALDNVAETNSQLLFVSTAMRKQMARSPIGDDEITSTLVWLQDMIETVIVGPPVPAPVSAPPPASESNLSESDLRILELLGNGEDLIPPHSISDTPQLESD